MQLSSYQQAIIAEVADPQRTGNVLVNAVAGGAKTTTSVLAAREARGKVIFLAFGKDIATTLQRKLEGTEAEARTIHSLSFRTVSRSYRGLKVVDNKYRKLAREWVEAHEYEWIDDDEQPRRDLLIGQLTDLVNKVRLTLTDPRDRGALWSMADRFGIQPYAPLLPGIAQLIDIGERQARAKREFDFTDLMYLSLRWELQPDRYDFIFVDEAQDLSALLLAFVQKALAPKGRMVMIGDSHQAIMGFAGAMTDSMDHIERTLRAKRMPLSICYRCPKSHIELVKPIVPHIEAAPHAAEGVIVETRESQILSEVQPGDAIICRLNAPLISLCLKLIARRVPAKVRGRNVAEQLKDTVEEVAKHRDFEWDQFLSFLNLWAGRQADMLAKRDASDSAFEALADRIEGIIACYQAFAPADVQDFCRQIDELFTENGAAVILSSVHRFKGQEAERVFVLRPELLDKPFGRKQELEWETQQRHNLKYVALTRATATMFLVYGDGEHAVSAPAAPTAIEQLEQSLDEVGAKVEERGI